MGLGGCGGGGPVRKPLAAQRVPAALFVQYCLKCHAANKPGCQGILQRSAENCIRAPSDCSGRQNLPSSVLKWRRWNRAEVSFVQSQQDSKNTSFFNTHKSRSEASLDLEKYFVPLGAPRLLFHTLNKMFGLGCREKMLLRLNNVTVYCGFWSSEGFNLFGCDSCIAAAGRIFSVFL